MKSKYETALRLSQGSGRRTRRVYDLLTAADRSGDPRATYALATWYLHGTKFTKKDLTVGTQMLERAAELGVADACYDLAVSYEEGIVVNQSKRKAFELYMRAALLGEKQSVYEVGRMYYHGIGTRKSIRLANLWLDRAKELGVE